MEGGWHGKQLAAGTFFFSERFHPLPSVMVVIRILLWEADHKACLQLAMELVLHIRDKCSFRSHCITRKCPRCVPRSPVDWCRITHLVRLSDVE